MSGWGVAVAGARCFTWAITSNPHKPPGKAVLITTFTDEETRLQVQSKVLGLGPLTGAGT